MRKRGFTEELTGGINNPLGDAYNYSGPMLWSLDFIHDAADKPDKILAAIDSVIGGLQAKTLPQDALDRALVKIRARRYRAYGQFGGFGKADALASFALFDDNPELINRIEGDLLRVTPALIQKVAGEWLRQSNRTVIILEAGAGAKGGK